MNRPHSSKAATYISSAGSIPADFGTQRYTGGIVLVLSFLFFSSCAFGQTALTPPTLSFPNQAVGFASVPKTATFKNTQTVSLTINSIAISGTDATDYAWLGGTCTAGALGAMKSCIITVVFTPTASGIRTATLTVTDSATTSPQSIALTGSGVAPVSLLPTTLAFGTEDEGVTSGAKTETLKNYQTVPLTIDNIAISGIDGGDYASGGTCPINPNTLGTGKSCSITVTFTPSALGSRTATLTVTDSASTSPQSIALTGTGVAPVTVSPTKLTFASLQVGATSIAQTITLTNHLKTSLTVSIVASGDFAVSSSTCGSSVGAGLNCKIGVTFTPTTVGSRQGTVTINDSAFGSPTLVALNGTGKSTGPPVLVSITVTPTNPSITTGTTQQFTATGMYSDGSMQNLTSTATWSSSTSGVATINASGLASATGTGQTTIKAASGAINGSTTLTVTVAVGFVPTGSLNTSRYYHTATVLNDGTVLITGGEENNSTFVASAELYNPVTGSFTVAGSMITVRDWHTATLLNNGMVLIAGGANHGGTLASAELYDPTTETFTATGSMNTGRYFATATLLNNGKVLIAGGFTTATDLTVLGSAELYDPTTGIFTITGSLNTAVGQQAATLLNNGKVLISGGDTASFVPTTSAELYDPATETFSTTGSANIARRFHTATLLNNGLVLIAGGNGTDFNSLSSAELFDPVAETFSVTGSLNIARDTDTATLLNNGTVLIAGGETIAGGQYTAPALASAEIYDPAAATFSFTSTMNTARVYHIATLLNNGMVLIAGGEDGVVGGSLASAELYEPVMLTPPNLVSIAVTPATSTISPQTTQQFLATGTFSDSSTEQLASVTWSTSDTTLAEISNGAGTQGLSLAIAPGTATITASAGSVSGSATLTVRPTGSVSTGNLNTARELHTATLLNNGMVLIAGGFNGIYLTSAELYDPGTGVFSYTGNLNMARCEHTATLLNNGMVLVAGGSLGNGGQVASAELYNPATGTFTLTGSLNVARYGHTATLLGNGMVLITGGYNSSGNLSSAELYNPATGTFTLTGSLNVARYGHTATLLGNGMVLIAGGFGTDFLATAELYNSGTGAFTLTGSLNIARENHTAALANNGMVLIAGGSNNGGILGSAELYNFATKTFTLTGSLNIAREGHTETVLIDGLILIEGGFNMSGGAVSGELYNSATNMFSITSNLVTARTNHTATLLDNGMALIVGGTGSSGFLSSSELY